jgi:GNAT superfamily N-acetyltransferase
MLDRAEVQVMDAAPAPAFDCGRDVQNAFFYERAWDDQRERLSTTYLLTVHGLTAGFLSLCMDSLPLSRTERGAEIRYQWVSALKLAQLGIDRRFQSLGLGRRAVGFVVDFASELSLRVGCRYVTLDAQPDLVSWYAAQGFRRNLLHQQQREDEAIRHRRDPAATAVSMRYDIREHAG